jgi:hypothetical protein
VSFVYSVTMWNYSEICDFYHRENVDCDLLSCIAVYSIVDESGSDIFLRNVGKHLQDNRASPRRPQFIGNKFVE